MKCIHLISVYLWTYIWPHCLKKKVYSFPKTAFLSSSCFGVVSSLNGEPEKGIAVEVRSFIKSAEDSE